MFFLRKKRRASRSRKNEVYPDEILMDSSNIPRFDTDQFEGRLEKPISKASLYLLLFAAFSVFSIFIVKAFEMQVVDGYKYAERSEKNILRPVPVFAGRGVVYDRNGVPLAWNAPSLKSPDDPVVRREYATSSGLAHTLGYVRYPSKDDNGFYYRDDFEGVDGAEKYFDSRLRGTNGSRLIEVNARGEVISQNVMKPPEQGENIYLSIDSKVQSALYSNIKDVAERVGFAGGAGVIMDVENGEVLALASYPEYDSQVMSDLSDSGKVKSMLNDSRLLFLDRAIDGLYTPGSIVKPFMALGALAENVIDPSTVIVTTGSISIPNPYDSSKSTVFRDWKNLGPVDMRRAIAMSSDAYFYIVGGGYKDQKGLGIRLIDKYLQMFGFGIDVPESFFSGKAGVIPTPEWKKQTFDEDWYLGNTYHTAIGQYGFQTTPIQVVRAIAAIANKGKMIVPTIHEGDGPKLERRIDLPSKYFDIIHEGMRQVATNGTGIALNVPYVKIAAKTGTAELGLAKANVNSWVTGFWPYERPKYAFVVMMEKGSVHNLIGAAAVMRQQIDWMHLNTPEYLVQ